jgi:hypothetical protein
VRGWLPRFTLEAGQGGADVSLAKLGRGGNLTGQEPAPERTEWHEPDAELRQGGQDLVLGLAPEQGVLTLQRRDGLHCMGAADRSDAGLGHPEVVDHAGLDELFDGAGDVLDGDVRVDAVLVEQVDGLGPQATEGTLDGGADVVRSAGDTDLLAVLVEREPELCGDDDILADGLQCLSHQLLVVEGAVDLSGVEQGDAPVHRGTDESDHLVSWWSGTERLAHAHAAQAEGGHSKA